MSRKVEDIFLEPLVIDLDKCNPDFIKEVLQPIWDLQEDMEEEDECVTDS